jgi:8-oxo-dGTP pyrophosphatase MutT (NUDIX family)
MHRRAVLRLLLAHGDLPLGAAEQAAVDETLALVEARADCLLRTCAPGHLTGSAWILSPDRRRTLLTLHRKLGRWLQLGGHADGDPDIHAVALREAREESGLAAIRPLGGAIFDIDRHWIPGRGSEPGHWHHDLRFLFEADPSEPLVVAALNPEEAMVRLVGKTRAYFGGDFQR